MNGPGSFVSDRQHSSFYGGQAAYSRPDDYTAPIRIFRGRRELGLDKSFARGYQSKLLIAVHAAQFFCGNVAGRIKVPSDFSGNARS
jgi:hypothetical protein